MNRTMKHMTLAALAALVALAGCSSPRPRPTRAGPDRRPPPETPSLGVFPTVAYAGVEDTGAAYSVPISVTDGKRRRVDLEDAAHATVSGNATSATIRCRRPRQRHRQGERGRGDRDDPGHRHRVQGVRTGRGRVRSTPRRAAGAATKRPAAPTSRRRESASTPTRRSSAPSRTRRTPKAESSRRRITASRIAPPDQVGLVAYLRSLPARGMPKQDD